MVEALVRWNHPTAGLLNPAEFLPLAEHDGLMRALDRLVLDHACRQAGVWRDQGRILRVAVNISRDSLLDETFSSELAAALIRHRLEGPEIEIEITENGVIGDPRAAAFFAERLAGLGVRLAIDDFGTGYSSLAQLRRLRVSTLKIDKSFVDGVATDAEDVAIVETVIQLGHRFGQDIVAEGIENELQLEILRAMGADHGQGYFLSRPLPAARIDAWLDHRTSAGIPV
jgi:EAL domain-containing protein (putative c-di-GMP-specific phosphodiesterase class I)